MPKVEATENTVSTPAGARRALGSAHASFLLAVSLACGSAAALSGCAAGPVRWQSQLGLEHPLTGRIWDVAEQSFTTEDAMMDRLAAARFVLAGEQHDDPDHHVLQARIIKALVRRDQRPAVVMEMLDVDDTEAIHSCLEAFRCTPERFAAAVDWEHSGWPDWHIYEPVLAAALRAGLPIAPASLTPARVHAFATTGDLGDDAEAIHRLGLDVPLAPEVHDAIAADVRESHCGYAPEEMIEGMVAAQRLRDAHMAESLLMAAPLGHAVLIAGLEHVRGDRAVPVRLRVLAPEDGVLSVGLLEVDDEATSPGDYARRFGTESIPLDFVWFTPRMDDSDPCEKFREQLEKIREPAKDGGGSKM